MQKKNLHHDKTRINLKDKVDRCLTVLWSQCISRCKTLQFASIITGPIEAIGKLKCNDVRTLFWFFNQSINQFICPNAKQTLDRTPREDATSANRCPYSHSFPFWNFNTIVKVLLIWNLVRFRELLVCSSFISASLLAESEIATKIWRSSATVTIISHSL